MGLGMNFFWTYVPMMFFPPCNMLFTGPLNVHEFFSSCGHACMNLFWVQVCLEEFFFQNHPPSPHHQKSNGPSFRHFSNLK